MRRWITSAICGIVAFLAAFTNPYGAAGKAVEDVLYHHPGGIDGRIRIIAIDDRSMGRLGDFSGWDRDVYAELVETLTVSEEIRPAVIGFDILFNGEKDPASDERFAQACAAHGNVITGFSYVFGKEVVSDGEGGLVENALAIQDRVLPYPALREATDQGFVNALMDADDGVIRSAFLYFDEPDGSRAKSFNAAIYEAYMAGRGETPRYPAGEGIFGFRYSGGVSDYEHVSLSDVLDGAVPPEAFDDCIVLVGVYAPGMMDAYFVPVDRGAQMYGVEIHANVIQAILEGKTLSHIPPWLDGLIAAVIAVLLAWFCERLSVGKTLLLCGAALVLRLAAGFGAFRMGFSMDVLTAPILALAVGIYYTALHYARARKARRDIEQAFSKYVAPQVVDKIAKSGVYELSLGGENRDIAVLFVDIRGFTPLSESLAPAQVVDILNGYLALTTRCIFRHGGTLDKFIGDATMAVFNAPFDTEDYVHRAVLTAWDIVQGGNRIETEYAERYGKHVGFGVGVNCGPAVVGNIGCEFRMDYTAIGDTVNTAARLEANAPKGTVYISGAVYEAVKDRITADEVGAIPLKGKSDEVFVYAVTGIPGYYSPEAGGGNA